MSEFAGDHVSTYSTCIVMFLLVHKLMFADPDCASVCVHVPKGAVLSLCVGLFLLINHLTVCLSTCLSICMSVCLYTCTQNVAAIVVGSRAHLQDEAVARVSSFILVPIIAGFISNSLQRSFFRNLLMYMFHFLVYVLCVRGIKDTQCGFKMLTRAAVPAVFLNLHIERW